MRRFPVRQDSEVGWLADPEAQAQIGDVSLSLLTLSIVLLFVPHGRMMSDGANGRSSDSTNWH